MTVARRTVIKQGVLMLTALSTGTLTWRSCFPVSDNYRVLSTAGGELRENATAGFGWEVQLNNNGADVYFSVEKKITLVAADIDTSLMMVSAPTKPGPVEVLCSGAVFRGSPPKFPNSKGAAYIPTIKSSDFGEISLSNPNNLVCNFNHHVIQDLFYSVILKAWVPLDGTGSSTARHIRTEPSLILNARDHLVFHMDHFGAQCNAEMQVVLTYVPS